MKKVFLNQKKNTGMSEIDEVARRKQRELNDEEKNSQQPEKAGGELGDLSKEPALMASTLTEDEKVQEKAPSEARQGEIINNLKKELSPGGKSESTPPTGQEKKERPATLKDTYAQYLELLQPKRDESRLERLERQKKITGIGNALNVLATTIGAGQGASVPKINYQNLASDEHRRLVANYEDQERAAQSQAVLQAIQDMRRGEDKEHAEGMLGKQQDFSREQTETQMQHAEGMFDKRTEHSEKMFDKQTQARKEFHDYTLPNYDIQDRKINGINMTGQVEKKTGQWTPFPYQTQGQEGQRTASGRTITGKEFALIVDRNSNVIKHAIRDESEAINIMNQILEGEKKNEHGEYEDPQLQRLAQEMHAVYNDGLQGNMPKHQFQSTMIAAIDRYWDKHKPQVHQGTRGWAVEEAMGEWMNPAEGKEYAQFVQNNHDQLDEDMIVDYLQNNHPTIEPETAKEIARRDIISRDYFQERARFLGMPPSQRDVKNMRKATYDYFFNNEQNMQLTMRAVDNALQSYDNPDDRLTAVAVTIQDNFSVPPQIAQDMAGDFIEYYESGGGKDIAQGYNETVQTENTQKEEASTGRVASKEDELVPTWRGLRKESDLKKAESLPYTVRTAYQRAIDYQHNKAHPQAAERALKRLQSLRWEHVPESDIQQLIDVLGYDPRDL